MKTIKSMLAVGLLSLSFAGFGCGGDADTSKYENAIKALCACTDEACMDKARDDRRDFRKSLGDKYKKKEDAPESLIKKMEELDKKWSECSDKAREAAAGSEKPAAADDTN
ncbi:MAG TPA: hypothetical protein VML75_09245 [Kofleriaceae bacterium]|nr:hypothetical protein [Kofleriaceae bacterium]